MGNTVVKNSDDVDTLKIILPEGSKFRYLMQPTGGAIDLINAKIRVSTEYCDPFVKEYTIGDGLEAVDGTDIRWSGETIDFLGRKKLVFDAYLANVSDGKRSFKGVITINPTV